MDPVEVSPRFWRVSFRSPLYRNALSLIASEAVSAGLGLGFWVLVARLFPDRDAGVGSVLITSATLLASASTLGFHLGLIRFLPEHRGREAPLINTSTTVAAVVAAILAAAYGLTANIWSPVVGFLREDPVSFALFVAFTAVWSAYLVLDAAFVGLGAARFVLFRAMLYGSLKIALPLAVIPTVAVPIGLFSAWGIGLLASNVVAVGLLLPRIVPRYLPRPTFRLWPLAPMFRFAIGNYAATIFAALPGLTYPLVIAGSTRPEDAVYFYIAWSISGILHLIPGSIFLSVLAEGSRRHRELGSSTRSGLVLSFALLTPAVAATLFASDVALTAVFPLSYRPAVPILNILALSSLPATLSLAYATALRVQKRIGHFVGFSGGISIAALALGAGLVVPFGPVGAALGFALVQAAGAVISFRGMLRQGLFRPRSRARNPG